MHNDDLSNIMTYELGPELLLDAGLGPPSQGRGRPAAWQPLFWPPHFKKEGHDFTTAGNILTEHRLLELGEQLSEFRTRLRLAALAANEQEAASSPEDLQADLGKLGARIHKGYFTSASPKADSGFSHKETPAPARKKGSKRAMLTQSEKLAIVHAVVVKLKKLKDVAKEYRVTVSTVGVLVHKARRKPKFIEELFAK